MKSVLVALTFALAASTVAYAQEKPKPTAAGPIQTLKVQVVLSRFDGDKKISSMPYTLLVNVGEGLDTELNVGVQVPVQVVANNTVTVAFKDAGTDIRCRALPSEGGRFPMVLTVSQSGLYLGDGAKGAGERVRVGENPILKNFFSSFRFQIRDGETKQLATATDPVNGNVLKVDVTVDLMK